MFRLIIESNISTFPLSTIRIKEAQKEIKTISALTDTTSVMLRQNIQYYLNNMSLTSEQRTKLELFMSILRKFSRSDDPDKLLILNFE